MALSKITTESLLDGTIVSDDLAAGVGGTNYSGRNDIINGGLVVNQENETAPADDAYTIGDLFLHVGEGTPVMSLETDGPQGTRPWQKMVLDANAQGGLVYFLSNDDIQDYIANGKMSFGIQLKTTAATISNARIGILKWVGTADAVTSDVVGTWASDGTNPTLATSWSYENTPANIGLTTSWARHTVEDVTVDADATNLAVFIWTDDGTITASDVIGFSEWQMNPGATVNDFSSYDGGLVKSQVTFYVEIWPPRYYIMLALMSTTSSRAALTYRDKFKTPTISFAAAADYQMVIANVLREPSAISATTASPHGADMTVTHAADTAGRAGILRGDGGGNDFIKMDARF